ncbi:hypothetical protein BDW72DRAFT_192157 [Aspergillus terricola var. indicus]
MEPTGQYIFGLLQISLKEQFMGKVFTNPGYLSVVLLPTKPTRNSTGAAKGLFPQSCFMPTVELNPYDCLHAWKLLNLFWGKVNRPGAQGRPEDACDPCLPVFHTEPAASLATRTTGIPT